MMDTMRIIATSSAFGGRNAVVLVVWIAMALGGMAVLLRYALAGSTPETHAGWPAGSDIERHVDKPTLVLLVHPKCPCSRATLNELAVLLARHGERLDTHVMFVRPEHANEGWENTDLWRLARTIPGVRVHLDVGGVQARRFAARTSGEAALYAPDGRLLFVGGLTSARGHAGDNAGRDTISHLLDDMRVAGRSLPVFGCPLFDLSR